jgi:hypothetical protein
VDDLKFSDLLLILGLIAVVVGNVATFGLAFRLGVNPAQRALVESQSGTIISQRERITVLEADVKQLRSERDSERTERLRLERRVSKLERLIVDKFLAMTSEQIDRLLDSLGPDSEVAA